MELSAELELEHEIRLRLYRAMSSSCDFIRSVPTVFGSTIHKTGFLDSLAISKDDNVTSV